MDTPVKSNKPARKANVTTLGAGDTVNLTGEVTITHDDGKATVWVKGLDYPITLRAEHLALIAKRGKSRDG